MRIGVPREIKNHEYRVGLTPASVRELARRGHQVIVQQDAGTAIGLSGSSGNSTGPHLHYEIWHNGSALDPRPFMDHGAPEDPRWP